MLFRPAQSFENIKFMDDKKINKKYKSNVFCNLLYHIIEDKKKRKLRLISGNEQKTSRGRQGPGQESLMAWCIRKICSDMCYNSMNLNAHLLWAPASPHGKESTQQKWSSILARSDHRVSSSGSSAKKQNRGMFQGYAPSYMETSNILSHRHVPLCFDRDFPVFYDIVLFHFTQIHFVFWPHASVCNAQYPWWETMNLPLFWTCHLLASFHVSEIS